MAFIKSAVELSGLIHEKGPFIEDVPVLYMTENWSKPDKLGGYSTGNDAVPPEEILTSYISAWYLAFNKSQVLEVRLFRAAMSYCKAQKKDLLAGVVYLFDLYKAGYILRTDAFMHTAWILLEVYVKIPDHAAMIDEMDFSREGVDDAHFFRFAKLVEKKEPDKTTCANIFLWLWEKCDEEISHARSADNIDDFIVGQAKLQGILELMGYFWNTWEADLSSNLSFSALYSHLEEIRADVGGYAVYFRAFRLEDKIYHYVTSMRPIWKAYQMKMGDEWLDAIMEDRMFFAEGMRPFMESKTDVEELEDLQNWPDQWIFFREKAAFGLEAALDISMALNKSEPEQNDFDASQQEYEEVVLPLMESFDSTPKEHWPMLLDTLKDIANMYPCFSPYQFEVGVRLDQLGRYEEAEKYLTRAILLDCNNSYFWHSMATVFLHLGSDEDAKFCHGMRFMLEQKGQS